MKISGDSLLNNAVSAKYDAAVSDMSKTLAQMKSGDKFEGTVIDIKQNSVTLKLDDNNIINAKSLVNPDLRIGERASFTVKENSLNQIFVEISKTESESLNFVKELLNNAEMPATKENMDLVKFLIDNNMPVDKKTIADALYFKYANETGNINNGKTENLINDNINSNQNMNRAGLKDISNLNADELEFKNIKNMNSNEMNLKNISNSNNVLEKVLFLLKEEMPTGKVTVDTLNRLIDNNTALKSELSTIASEISKMPDSKIKDALLRTLDINKSDFSSPKELRQAISEKLFFNKDDFKSHENLTEKFEKIFEISSKGGEVLAEVSEEIQNNVVKQSFDNIKNDLNFMKEIDNYKNYVQIPISVDGRESECELHIFKNSKGNKNFSKRASVLLSLDYFFVGKIDTFIEKIDKNLAFQFKCEKKDTINLIKKNINELSELLDDYGFKITNVSYKEKDESFNVMKNKSKNSDKNTSNRRYSFDMRV